MKSSFAALAALIAAALVFFAYNPAHAAMSGLYSAAPQTGAAIVEKTGSKRRGMLSDGLAYGLAVASEFTTAKNSGDYSKKGREFGRARGCPPGTQNGKNDLKCFWTNDNGGYIYGN